MPYSEKNYSQEIQDDTSVINRYMSKNVNVRTIDKTNLI